MAQRWFQICARAGSPLGLSNRGLDLKQMGHVNIDIGDLPVLEQLKSENVNGILGNDLLMRCDVLHLNFSDNSATAALLMERK